MSSNFTFYLQPLTALEALTRCCELSANIFPGKSVNLHLNTNISGLTTDLQNTQKLPSDAPQLKEFRRRLEAAKVPIMCRNFAITEQGHANNSPQISYSIQDEITAQITGINISSPDAAIHAMNCLGNTFNLVSKSSLLFEHLPQPHANALKLQHTALTDLRAQLEKLAQFSAEQLTRQDEFFRKLAAEQDRRLQERENELGERNRQAQEELNKYRQQLDEEHRLRLGTLEERERQHQRKELELDARENTVVRRDLLKQIQAIIGEQKEIELSEKTNRKRIMVHILCAATLVASMALISVFAYKVAHDDSASWHHLAPLSAGLVLLASTLVYYLKWNDQWFREHAQAEFRNKKLNSDILRASWLAELFFEGNEKDRQLPDMLLSRFSEGLFLDSSGPGVEHPSDQFVDFVKKLSTIKLDKNGVEITKSSAKEK